MQGPNPPEPSPTVPEWGKHGRHRDGSLAWVSVQMIMQYHHDKAHPRSIQEVNPWVRIRSSDCQSEPWYWGTSLENSPQAGFRSGRKAENQAQLSWRPYSSNTAQEECKCSRLSLNRAHGLTGVGRGPRWGWSWTLWFTRALGILWACGSA